MTDITATTEAQIVDAVEGARDWKSPLNIVGNRTKRSFGRPTASWGTVLDVSDLKGIVDYKPEELIITARPGTPVAEIMAALAEKNQRLGFDPPDLGPLFGAAPNTGTIGGAISCDLAGSAAVRYGRARDHLLGIHAVNGKAEAFKAGGKVVKNVTGFDIPKLFCGAFGTLAILTEVTLRVFPKPEDESVWEVTDLTPEQGLRLLRMVWSSPLEPTGLIYIPGDTRRTYAEFGNPGKGICFFRFEGADQPLEEKRSAFTRVLKAADIRIAAEIPNADEEFEALGLIKGLNKPDIDIWRISVPPANAAALVLELQPALWTADWAGGLLWLGMKESTAAIHAIATRHDAHATLVRASEATRNAIAPFPPLSSERLALTRAVKAAFDPLGLFNPGRMYSDV